jgi:hypothetical protein
MDIYQLAAGASLPNMGYILGTAGNCSAYGSAGPTMCWYAAKNGFSGYSGGAASVSWTFPSSVPGATAPPSASTQYPFMQVSVSLPVKTYFSTLLTANQTQTVSASSSCGVTQIMQGAPIMVLNPSVSGALSYSGGASLAIVGGPPRSIVVNSSSATAVLCGSSGVIDTHLGGPNFTGSDVGTYGGPTTAPGASTGCYGSNGNTGLPAGFDGARQPGRRSLRRRARRRRHENRDPADQVGERLLHSCGGGDRWLSRPEPHQLLWLGTA